jgi:hypothetical protein
VWSASRPGRFTSRERAPSTHWLGGWVGSRAVLDAVVKRKIPSPRRESNPRTPIVQPVAQLYTDCFTIFLGSLSIPLVAFCNNQMRDTTKCERLNARSFSVLLFPAVLLYVPGVGEVQYHVLVCNLLVTCNSETFTPQAPCLITLYDFRHEL